METRPGNPDYSGNKLTLKDIGVSKDELEALKPNAPVVDINEYRSEENAKKINKNHDSRERTKKLKAGLLAAATLLGSAKLTYEAFREKIHPAHRVVSAGELDSADEIEIDSIKPGSELVVSPYSFTITGGNVRTTPHVQPGLNEEPDENLVQNADLTGKVITHPIEVADQTNSSNEKWYVFYDSDGQSFAINGQNVEHVADQNVTSSDDIRVTVDKTTNMGIIAHDKNNVTMQVATVVEVTG